jgi:hypothetical protein
VLASPFHTGSLGHEGILAKAFQIGKQETQS